MNLFVKIAIITIAVAFVAVYGMVITEEVTHALQQAQPPEF